MYILSNQCFFFPSWKQLFLSKMQMEIGKTIRSTINRQKVARHSNIYWEHHGTL